MATKNWKLPYKTRQRTCVQDGLLDVSTQIRARFHCSPTDMVEFSLVGSFWRTSSTFFIYNSTPSSISDPLARFLGKSLDPVNLRINVYYLKGFAFLDFRRQLYGRRFVFSSSLD